MPMPLTTTMQRFCLAHAQATVVPAESLSEQGMDPAWAEHLLSHSRLTSVQLGCLEQGFALYWRRTLALFARAPGSWFSPRQVNLLLVGDILAVPPYFDPFAGTSSLLYLSDLDCHPEYVAFLLVHNERIALLHSMRAALICNLSYWLCRDDEARQAFARAARHATRPDAAVFVRLADAFEWIVALRHADLHPPDRLVTEPCLTVPGADLFVPKRLQTTLVTLCDDAEASLRRAMQLADAGGSRRPAATNTRLDELCDWLCDARAHLIVRTADGVTAWKPGAHDCSALREALSDASDAALESLHLDLRVVHGRSLGFLAAVRDRDALPRHSQVLIEGDGAWLDA
ncbi:MAG: hypothetical protein OEY03_06235, partial [Rhizobacter sp.]|nr:hypothetical protein [Rhizobacter sp.]